MLIYLWLVFKKTLIFFIIMPLYFKELEQAIHVWYKIYSQENPCFKNNPYLYNTHEQKREKIKLLKRVLKLFKKIEEYQITVIPDINVKDNVYIKIDKNIKSKL